MPTANSYPLPINLYSSAQVQELDTIAIRELKYPAYELMSSAGKVAFLALQRAWPQAQTLTIFCGTGNNGADGLVLAKIAHKNLMKVVVYQIGEVNEAKCSPEALRAREEFTSCDLKTRTFHAGLSLDSDVVVDALLGTGLNGPLRPEFKEAILAINAAKAPVMAVDIPSGLDGETGHVPDVAVKADLTVAFVGLKSGLLTGMGPDHTGELLFSGLNVPEQAYRSMAPFAKRLELLDVIRSYPPRRQVTHKGDYGHVLAACGLEPQYTGALALAGLSALRAGAGLVSGLLTSKTQAHRALCPPEMMCYELEDAQGVLPLLEKSSHALVGPGLGLGALAKGVWQACVNSALPLVVDGDALTLLAQAPCTRDRWVLTPHPGEAARLLGVSIPEIQFDRFQAARAIADKYQADVVLKGAGTVVYERKTKQFSVSPYGNPYMATAGMGDVLAGLIVSLMAQGLSMGNAARLGVCVHALAADSLIMKKGGGLIAGDVPDVFYQFLNPKLKDLPHEKAPRPLKK